MTIDRILVLEREGAGSEALEQLLAAEGYPVLRARDVSQAARLVRSGPIQLCILELHPSLVDVREFLEKMRTLHPNVPRVLYVAPRDLEPVQHLLECGDEVLLRPTTSAHLVSILDRYRSGEQAQAESERLQQLLWGTETAESLVTETRGMRDVIERAERSVADRAALLLRGPVGSGRKLVSRYFHERSRKDGPFFVFSCAQIQPSLQESELFGHEPGAFPGATEMVPGLLELAHRGTVVLEEVGMLGLEVQQRLHRFLQSGTIRRMGGQRSLNLQVRIIATTSTNLLEEANQGRFSSDLLRRLSQQCVTLPPLVERKQDLGTLARRFLQEAPAHGLTRVRSISPEAISALQVYHWPGNVAELRQVIDRAVLQDAAETVMPEHLSLEPAGADKQRALQQAVGMTVADMERELILRTLENCKGNRTAASKLLGLTTRTLSNKIRIYRAQGYHVIGGRKKPVQPSLR